MTVVETIVSEINKEFRLYPPKNPSERSERVFQLLDYFVDERLTDDERMQAIYEEDLWEEILNEKAGSDRGGWVKTVRDIVDHVLGGVVIAHLDLEE